MSEAMRLSVRAEAALRNAFGRLPTREEILATPPGDLFALPNCGIRTMREICEAVGRQAPRGTAWVHAPTWPAERVIPAGKIRAVVDAMLRSQEMGEPEWSQLALAALRAAAAYDAQQRAAAGPRPVRERDTDAWWAD